jgi:hypothetical protein
MPTTKNTQNKSAWSEKYLEGSIEAFLLATTTTSNETKT